jgi:hypothetical protein
MAKRQDGRIDEKQIDEWLKKGHQCSWLLF